MSHWEEKLLERCSGRRILIGSLIFGAVGVAPLLLYIIFGPADGNPIGLGLLAMASLPLAAFGVLIGLVKLVVEFFRRGN